MPCHVPCSNQLIASGLLLIKKGGVTCFQELGIAKRPVFQVSQMGHSKKDLLYYIASVRSGPHHSTSTADASAKIHSFLITFYTWNEDTKFKVIRFFMALNQGGQVASITCGKISKAVLTGVLFHFSCILVPGEIPAKTGNKVNTQIKIPSVEKAQI